MLTDEVRAFSSGFKWLMVVGTLLGLMFVINTIKAPDAEYNSAMIATATHYAMERGVTVSGVIVPTENPPGVVATAIPFTATDTPPEPIDSSSLTPTPDTTSAETVFVGASSDVNLTNQNMNTQFIRHTIQGGDTLYAISVRYGTTVNEITAANINLNPNYLLIGEVVNIPVTDANRDLITAQGSQVGQIVTLIPTQNLSPVDVTLAPDVLALTPTVRQNALNEIPIADFIVMPRNVLENSREIFRIGLIKGRNPKAFSKIGDSTIENPLFMDRFDEGPYDLGDYRYLQPVIDWFQGSFSRDSVAVRVGFHSWSAFDPMWATRADCQSGEGALECEIRLNNPSFLFIRLGSNDLGVSKLFEDSMRKIIEYCLDEGIVPIIGTKGDRAEGSNINNEILRKLAAEYEVPLWDFDLLAATIPGRGLGNDGVHMTTWYMHDYTNPVAFRRGHGVHSLGGLMMLDAVLNDIIQPERRD